MAELNPSLVIYKILKQLSTLVTTAFAIAAGYEWRVAIAKFLRENIEIDDENIFVYPLIVTIIAVVATIAIEAISLKFLSTRYMKNAQESSVSKKMMEEEKRSQGLI